MRKGWTANDLAARMGFSSKTLQRAFYGETRIHIDFVEDVAHVLGVHPATLVWPNWRPR